MSAAESGMVNTLDEVIGVMLLDQVANAYEIECLESVKASIAALLAERNEKDALISIMKGALRRIEDTTSYYCSTLARMALAGVAGSQKHSYHDLHITTADIPRTSIFNLPYGLQVSCCRVTGWRLERTWVKNGGVHGKIVAGEYDDFLRLDVDGYIIVDSAPPAIAQGEES